MAPPALKVSPSIDLTAKTAGWRPRPANTDASARASTRSPSSVPLAPDATQSIAATRAPATRNRFLEDTSRACLDAWIALVGAPVRTARSPRYSARQTAPRARAAVSGSITSDHRPFSKHGAVSPAIERRGMLRLSAGRARQQAERINPWKARADSSSTPPASATVARPARSIAAAYSMATRLDVKPEEIVAAKARTPNRIAIWLAGLLITVLGNSAGLTARKPSRSTCSPKSARLVKLPSVEPSATPTLPASGGFASRLASASASFDAHNASRVVRSSKSKTRSSQNRAGSNR